MRIEVLATSLALMATSNGALLLAKYDDRLSMQTQTIDTDHTQLVETLSAMILQLNALQALVCSDVATDAIPSYTYALHDGLTTLEQMTRAALQQARSIDQDFLPTELIGVTLPEALSRTIEETAEKLGLSSRIAFSGDERNLPSCTESLLYQIAQEALYQLQQYTGAHKLRLILTYGHDDVQLSIEHDGVVATKLDDAPAPLFTSTSPTPTSAVLIDLQQRIEHLGGSLQLHMQTEPGQLTRIHARIPYDHPEVSNNASNVVAASLGDSQPLAGSMSVGQVTRGAGNEVLSIPESPAREQVRVLVVEPQAVTRAGLRRLLESYSDLQVVGEAADGVQAVSETLELGPQVVLMDMQLPNGQSLEALRQIKQLNLNTQVLLLSALDREEYLYEALRAGAGGYVLKDIAPDDLAQAIHTVARGEVLVHPQLARRLLSQIGRQARGDHPYESLTAREQEVLRLLARGLRNKEMAARLHVSERTINFHLANIYQKLNVSGRTEALSKALEQGLITAG